MTKQHLHLCSECRSKDLKYFTEGGEGWSECQNCFATGPFGHPGGMICIVDDMSLVIHSDEFKKLCVGFYTWWWNQPGTNTEQGFDQWLASNPLDTDE